MPRKQPERRQLRKELLQLLQDNCNRPNTELAHALNVLPSTVSRLRSELESSGYIKSYRAEINPKKFGLQTLVFMQIALESERDFESTFKILEVHPEVQELHCLEGDYDFLIKLRVSTNEDVWNFIKTQLKEKHNFKKFNTIPVMTTLKETCAIPIDVNRIGTSEINVLRHVAPHIEREKKATRQAKIGAGRIKPR